MFRFAVRVFCGVVLVLLLRGVGGCTTEGRPVRKPPIARPQQPAGLKVDRLLVSTSQFPQDADRNGYFDTYVTTVYLFSAAYNLPIVSEGDLVFWLEDANGKQLRKWVFTAEDMGRELRIFNPGPGYQFRLSLLENGGDRLGLKQAELRWAFRDPSGREIVPVVGATVLTGSSR